MISFGPFSVYPGRRRLERDGAPVKLGARSLDILLALIERAGRVVSKNDLLVRVWQDVMVDESALRVHMASLRKALGDGQDGAHYLANVSGRGYTFIAEIVSRGVSGASLAGSFDETERTAEKITALPTNLPQNLPPIFGRTTELDALKDLIGQHRLVTLAGMGGIGKTRLAIELGLFLAPGLPGGAWLVDLAPLTDPSTVPGAAASVLGASLTNPEKAVETIGAALTKPTMLIFDNCEHLVGAVASLIDALLAFVPGLSAIVTSQEPLRIAPEHVFAVNPLALPPAGSAQAHAFGAVELFVARSHAALRGFQLNDVNAAGVTEICRRLEGIPLALEMAAARMPLLGVEGLSTHLNEPLRLLKFGAHAPDVRHRTLRDMVKWSYGLLDETERRVFRRLASFGGSFSLQAAAAVAGFEASDIWEASDLFGGLIEKSLVIVEQSDPPRYRLLETLRLFAQEKLAESGEAPVNAERHARFFTELLEQSYENYETTPETEWRARYEPEIDNVRTALNWAFADSSRRQNAVAMAPPVCRIFRETMYYEARRYAERAMQLIDADTPLEAAARLLFTVGNQASISNSSHALSLCGRAAEIYRKIGSDNLGLALITMGYSLRNLGRYEAAKHAYLEAREALATTDKKKRLFRALLGLGAVSQNLAEYEDARRYYEEAIELRHFIRDNYYFNGAYECLADLEFEVGSADRAVAMQRETVNLLRQSNSGRRLHEPLLNLASYLLGQNNVAEARVIAQEGFLLCAPVGGNWLRISLLQWALIGALEGRMAEAALLVGFVEAGFLRNRETMDVTEMYVYNRVRELLFGRLSAAEIQNYANESAAWTDGEAAGFAMSRLIST